jgi:hypothetical protein
MQVHRAFLCLHRPQNLTRLLSGDRKRFSQRRHLTFVGVASMKIGFFSDMLSNPSACPVAA